MSLRERLIKLLGGYTEQELVVKEQESGASYRIETVCATEYISAYEMHHENVLTDAEERLAKDIGFKALHSATKTLLPINDSFPERYAYFAEVKLLKFDTALREK